MTRNGMYNTSLLLAFLYSFESLHLLEIPPLIIKVENISGVPGRFPVTFLPINSPAVFCSVRWLHSKPLQNTNTLSIRHYGKLISGPNVHV